MKPWVRAPVPHKLGIILSFLWLRSFRGKRVREDEEERKPDTARTASFVLLYSFSGRPAEMVGVLVWLS